MWGEGEGEERKEREEEKRGEGYLGVAMEARQEGEDGLIIANAIFTPNECVGRKGIPKHIGKRNH